MEEPTSLNVPAVLALLESLRKEGAIPDYVIVGSVAAAKYGLPRRTKDIDIVILVDDLLRDYPRVWTTIAQRAASKAQGQMIVVDGTWLDVLATGGDPFYEDVLRQARRTRIFGFKVKTARPEHLIVMSLKAWREDPDFSRILSLLKRAQRTYLEQLIQKFDDPQGTLRKRFEWLSGPRPQ